MTTKKERRRQQDKARASRTVLLRLTEKHAQMLDAQRLPGESRTQAIRRVFGLTRT